MNYDVDSTATFNRQGTTITLVIAIPAYCFIVDKYAIGDGNDIMIIISCRGVNSSASFCLIAIEITAADGEVTTGNRKYSTVKSIRSASCVGYERASHNVCISLSEEC